MMDAEYLLTSSFPFCQFFLVAQQKSAFLAHLVHKLTSTNEHGPGFFVLAGNKKKKKNWEFNTFSNTQEGKVRPSSLHRKVHIISYSYWRIEPNSLSSAKTSGKITFIPSLFTCSTKNISFWIYDLLSMTVSHATTPLSCFWHHIWSMDLASLAAAKMMSCFHACLPACL